MNKKNVIFNYSLDQYNKKYVSRRHRLLKYTKQRVEDFDKQYGYFTYNGKTHSLEFKYYLLNGRKWCFIDDTYYEIPRPIRFTWFRNLNVGLQAVTCLCVTGVVGTVVSVPTILILSDASKAGIDETVKHVHCETRIVGDNIEITLKADSGFAVVGVEQVRIDSYILKKDEYKIEDSKIIIKKELTELHPGKIIVKPIIEERGKEIHVTDIKLNTNALEIEKGMSSKLIPTILPSDATNKEVKWESSEPSLVTVSDDGTVNGLDLTTIPVEITCTSKDNPACVARCKVSVVPLVSTLVVASKPSRWIYIIGDEFEKSGLKVNLVKGDKSTDVTNECTLDIKDGHIFTTEEKADEKNVTVKYNGLETTFIIAVNGDYSDYLQLNSSNEVQEKGFYQPKHLLMPEKLGGVTITTVAAEGFKNNNRITTLDLSKTKIKQIRREAFLHTEKLKTLIINKELNTLGDASAGGAFSSCEKLEEVVFLNTDKIRMYKNYYRNFNNTYKLSTLTIDSEAFANVKESDENYYDSYLYLRGVIYLKNEIKLANDSVIATKYEKAETSDKDGYMKFTFKTTF